MAKIDMNEVREDMMSQREHQLQRRCERERAYRLFETVKQTGEVEETEK